MATASQPTADAEGVARLDAAFDAWLEAQRAAINVVRTATDVPRTEWDVAEGYRWVTRMASLAQEWFVEKSDPAHPQLFQLQDEYRKLLVDNPDTRYLFAVLEDDRRYRLHGLRGDAAYVGLTFGTPIGRGAVGGRTGTTVQTNLDEFELGPNGGVDILIGPPGSLGDPAPRNSIELVPGTGQLAVRETFFDRRQGRRSDLRLDLVDPTTAPRLTSESLVPLLEFAGLFLQFVAASAHEMWKATEGSVNRLTGTAGSHHVDAQEDEVRSHSDAEMTYHGGRWALAEGEGLRITVHEPDRPYLYWGLTVASPWMESYDYRYATTSLNNHTSKRSADGSWELLLAPEDPGHPNWLDTGGRREGYMIVRWVLADDPPHPTCEVVSLR